MPLDRSCFNLRCECGDDDYGFNRRSLRWSSGYRTGQWILDDLFAAVHPSSFPVSIKEDLLVPG